MDSEQIEQIQHWIEDAVAPLRMAIEALSSEVEQVVKKVDEFESTDFASSDHYHHELASADHVERSEHDFRNQLSRLRDDISNVEYQVRDVERKAERAQSAADSASRNSRGYY